MPCCRALSIRCSASPVPTLTARGVTPAVAALALQPNPLVNAVPGTRKAAREPNPSPALVNHLSLYGAFAPKKLSLIAFCPSLARRISSLSSPSSIKFSSPTLSVIALAKEPRPSPAVRKVLAKPRGMPLPISNKEPSALVGPSSGKSASILSLTACFNSSEASSGTSIRLPSGSCIIGI